MCGTQGAQGKRFWLVLAVALLAALGGLSGCTSSLLARKIVYAPNRQFPIDWARQQDVEKAFAIVISETFNVSVGPPKAALSVSVVEPGNYDLEHTVKVVPGKDGGSTMDLKMTWKPRKEGSYPAQPVGTVVLLHGIFMRKETMLHWALYLAAAGYRTILVDLRGHGRSTGDWISYGKVEARDLVQVMDELERRELATKNVSVIGLSYGAAVGIHWAATDPRVQSLVLLQPYSEVNTAILGLARGNFRDVAKHFSDATFHRAIEKAPALAQFRWQDVSVLTSVKKLQVPLLIYHGKLDDWILPAHSEAIAAVAPSGSKLVLLENDHHITLAVRLDPIAPEVLMWLNKSAAGKVRSTTSNDPHFSLSP